MIARRWHGRIPAAKHDEYLQLMKDVGLADYRSTPGNRGAWCLHRHEGDIVHVEMFTLWDDQDAIRRFAGAEILKAKYYDFDPDFLLELEPGSCTSMRWDNVVIATVAKQSRATLTGLLRRYRSSQ